MDRRHTSYDWIWVSNMLRKLLRLSFIVLYRMTDPPTLNQTAKILARLIYKDPRLKTYADCSQKAFGPRAGIPTSIFFFVELFTVR